MIFFYTENDDFFIADFKEVMRTECDMTNLGLLRKCLGIGAKKTQKCIFISKSKYATNMLERFNMHNNEPAPTPIFMGLKLSKEDCSSNVNPTLYKSIVGSLMYLTTARTNIVYAVSMVSRFIEID